MAFWETQVNEWLKELLQQPLRSPHSLWVQDVVRSQLSHHRDPRLKAKPFVCLTSNL